MDQTTDERFMALALDEAHRCLGWDDVPVGCVIARADEVVAAAGNGRQRHHDPTAHAEVLALRDAAAATGTWHLEGCTLYVTLEPCAMCAGAIVLARVDRVVFGTVDPKAGFTGSLGNLVQDERLNHRTELTGGVLADECGHLLRSFFRDRR
ncbi:MAG: tRNA adenosine(34) deaminase TadA [Actinomycetota bacterium]